MSLYKGLVQTCSVTRIFETKSEYILYRSFNEFPPEIRYGESLRLTTGGLIRVMH
jgi:hypothetical protein